MTHTGFLHLEAESKGNKTIITNSFFDGVLKITRPAYLQNGLPLLTLIHVGGGYVDGDSYMTEVVVGESARLALTTQASTKIYKCPRYGVKQSADYFLKAGSELYVKQDSLIPYKDASFTQTANVYMSSSAVFYYTDIITPGWSDDGKLFTYKKVASKMRIFVDGSLEVFDHLLLKPTGKLGELMGLEGFTHIGTMFFIHPNISPQMAEELRDQDWDKYP
jgi:urease accessory protein